MKDQPAEPAEGAMISIRRVLRVTALGVTALGIAGCARYVSVRPRDPVGALGATVAMETVRRVASSDPGVDSVVFRLRVRAPRDSGVLLVVRPTAGASIRIATPGGESSAPPTPALRLVNRGGAGREVPIDLPLRTTRGEGSPEPSAALPAGVVLVEPGQQDFSVIAPIRRDDAGFGIRAYWYTTRLAQGETARTISLTDRTWRADSSQVYAGKVRTMPFMMIFGMGTLLCAVFLLATTR